MPMAESHPALLALDFDGVICDGLIEYFQTAWRAYCRIWSPTDLTPPEDLAPRFYRLRPVVETGWEMPVLLRSLLLDIPEAEIWQQWPTLAKQQAQQDAVEVADLAATVDAVRDEWIAADLEDWLAQHRFYPGVIERLQQILADGVHLVIVTTKEGRFVRQLLHQQGIELSEDQIFGKEVQQPKYETLRSLLKTLEPEDSDLAQLWFIEDRLPTLKKIRTHPDLDRIKLYLADWGYNTSTDRENAQHDPSIQLLNLDTFTQAYSAWLQ